MIVRINKDWRAWLSLIIGLSLCENITSILKIGSSEFTVAECLSVVIFVFFIMSNPGFLKGFLRTIPLSFKLFLLACVSSVIMAIMYFGMGSFYRYFVGIIELFIAGTAIFNIYILHDYKENIFKGIFWGLVLNIVTTFIMYMTFEMGSVFYFSGYFFQDLFYKPIYSFRSQGLFLEPSHMTRTVVVAIIPLMVFLNEYLKKHKIIYIFFLSTFIVMVLFSTSGSIVIGIVGIIFYLLIRKRKTKLKASMFWLYFSIILGIIVLLIFRPTIINTFKDYLSSIFVGAQITDSANTYRFSSMQMFAHLLPKYPLGCGWNMSGTVIEVNNLNTVAAFSDFLEMTIETGWLGISFYLVFIIGLVIRLFKKNNNYSISLGIALLCFIALQIGTDYPFDVFNMTIVALGLNEVNEGLRIRNLKCY